MTELHTGRSRALLAGVFLCIGGVLSCGPPNRHVQRNLGVAEISGSWELKASSLAHLVRDGYAPPPERMHGIEFLSDGTMTFSSVLLGIDALTYEEVHGVWKLQPVRSHQSANKLNNSLWIDLESRVSFSLGVREENDELSLWRYYRDPDLFEFLEYVRGQ